MKEITKEVVDATYPKPLGRGLLKWRLDDLDTERGETKHIVELDNGNIAYLRKIANSALLTDFDVLYGMENTTVVGLPECLGVDHVFLYSVKLDDPVPLQLGMEMRTNMMRKKGHFEMECPAGFEKDVVLTDVEVARLMKEAERSEAMRLAMGDLGRGTSFLCRLKSQFGDAIMIVDRDPDGGVTMNCYNVFAAQDVLRLLDGFDYLTSEVAHGYYTAITSGEDEESLAKYMRSKGYVTTRCIYAISAAPQGENNVH